MTKDCLFCKISKKEIPSHHFYQDKNFFAFLDIRPKNPGHTLIIPKKHYRWVWDVQEDYFPILKKIAHALQKAFNTEWIVSIVMGEEIPHAHIHLIPRFPNDGHGPLIDISKTQNISQEEMKKIAEKIKKHL